MQRSLKRYVGRPGAPGACEEPPPQQPGPSKPASCKPRGRSGLLAALGSQLVRGDGSGGEAAAASQAQPAQPLRERPANQQAAQLPAAQQGCERQVSGGRSSGSTTAAPPLPEQQQVQQHGGSQQQQHDAAPPGMQACPLCGQLLPAGEALQRHINEELDSMDTEGWAEDDWPSSSSEPLPGQQPGTQQQQQRRRLPPQAQAPPRRQQQQAAVLVLGGAPSVTAPTDRRHLAQLQRQQVLPPKRPRQLPTNEYNFYDDGRGGWGGEDLGLDGDAGGLKWEGMGTSEF